MKVAIIISNFPADQNVKKHLGFTEWKNLKVYEFNQRCIELNHLDKDIDADLFIFPTIHKSQSNEPCLTCHPPGNWGEARDGGESNTLTPAPAQYMKAFYLKLKEKSPLPVTLEATHHGPTLSKPALFVEIGSTEKEWNDPELGKVMAECIKEVFTQEPKNEPVVVVIGGTHYSQPAMKILEQTNYAVSHIAPKFLADTLTSAILKEAMEKSYPKADFIALDWKGMGSEKQTLKEVLDNANIPWKKVKEL